MSKSSTLFYAILLIAFSVFVSCKKTKSTIEPDTTPAPIKSAKFEISGNYSGHLFVVYNDNVSGNTTVTVTSLPWSKTIDYPSNVLGIGIGGNFITGNAGAAGQVANVKIYTGSTVVKSGSATADANGLINLPTLTYIFP